MNYQELLSQIALADERFVVLTAENRAAIRTIDQTLKERFIDTGITEQTMIGAAAGLALKGRIPVCHALAAFLTMRAFEFIRTDIGIASLPVKLVGGVSGFLSEANGPTHQAIEDISLMRAIPNMNIFCPSDEQDLLIGLREVLLNPNPFYIRFNSSRAEIRHQESFKIGKAEVVSEGKDITILTYGVLLKEALEAKRILEQKRLSVGLINLRTLKPLDEPQVLKTVNETQLVVTLEDHFITGGLYSIIAELLLKNRISANVLPIALENKWFKPALYHDILAYEGFTASGIAEKCVQRIQEAEIL